MSTNYVTCRHGEFGRADVEEAMQMHDFTISKIDEDNPNNFCITNGSSYVWCYCHTYEGVEYVTFTRYGGNYSAEEDILQPICNYLDTQLFSEHDPEYNEIMGYNDEEEDGE